MAPTKTQKWFPWTQVPLIVSAPMYGVAAAKLACEVTRAGGLGFVPFGIDMSAGSSDIQRLHVELKKARHLLRQQASPSSSSSNPGLAADTADASPPPLPVGVGILTFHASCTPENFARHLRPLLERHRPRVVWLFAPSASPGGGSGDDGHAHEWLIRELHALGATYPRARSTDDDDDNDDDDDGTAGAGSSSRHANRARGRHDLDLKVLVQAGTAAAALEALRVHGADGVVVQGPEAGGHQFAACRVGWTVGLPEIRSLLAGSGAGAGAGDVDDDGDEGPVLLAAGGIASGAGVVAALAIGADGAVMGTRFLASPEATVPDAMRQMILDERSGSLTTIKSSVFDSLKGPSIWPALYDGRAMIAEEHRDGIDRLPQQAILDRVVASPPDRVIWCGAGVGLVNEQLPAFDVVKQVQKEARDRILELGRLTAQGRAD